MSIIDSDNVLTQKMKNASRETRIDINDFLTDTIITVPNILFSPISKFVKNIFQFVNKSTTR